MKSRAAVAFGPGKPLEIVEIDVEPPRAGEVLVKLPIPVSAIPMLLPFQVRILKVCSRPCWDTKVPA